MEFLNGTTCGLFVLTKEKLYVVKMELTEEGFEIIMDSGFVFPTVF